MDYRLELEAYNGPLDLLLYLVKTNEVDIYDIPIASIAQQYLQVLELMKELNLEVAGEFMVMAATLMEIKSRMLLPDQKAEPEEQEEDPRAALVRELIAYRQYKQAADTLGELAHQQERKFPRHAKPTATHPQQSERPLEELSIWDIFAAFNKLMKETLGGLPTTITGEKHEVRQCMQALRKRLLSGGKLAFRSVFEGTVSRQHLICYFLALLELVRSEQVMVEQSRAFGTIYLRLRENAKSAPLTRADNGGPGPGRPG